MHDAELHAGLHGGGLSGGELVVELPLQPAMEVDSLGVLGGECRDGRVRRMLQLLGPLVPVAAVLLGERTPGGEVVEAAALARAIGGVRQLAAGGPLGAR